MVERLLEYERNMFYVINGTHTWWLDRLMLLFSSFWIWFPLLLVPAYFLWKRHGEWLRMTVCTLLSVACNLMITDMVFKPLFKRFRPTSHPCFMEHVRKVHDYLAQGDFGFISGHTTNAYAFAMLSTLAVKNKWYSISIFLWATWMAYSRIYLGAHFITDVVPGIILGILSGWGAYYIYIQKNKLPLQ
ncbi:MAG: phosphatase PAP2 family protein [Tannerella sp.]|jgi:undecaprenyl-diphosphatase|nr:phosphatase PAP2 family protein [Tannerella sp.]